METNVKVEVPEMGESISVATVSSWLKKEGDFVEAGEPICELETDKVTLEINSPIDGFLEKIHVLEGSSVEIKGLLAGISPGKNGETLEQKQNVAESQTPPNSLSKKDIVEEESPLDELPPAARKLVVEKHINLSHVHGSGKNGQVTKSDLLQYLENSPSPDTVESKKTVEPEKIMESEDTTIVPMTPIRQAIGKHLLKAQKEAAILSTFNEVDMAQVMELRKKHGEVFQQTHGVKLGFMGFFTKAVILALKKFPALNARIEGDKIIYNNHYHIGVAVGGPKGLAVPVVKNAEKMSIAELEKEILQLAEKVRQGKITLDELQGGTFSITNGGIYGSMLSTPILNYPQSGILGLHNIVKRPVVVEDEIVIRPVMYIALSYDHRMVDGKEAVQFLYSIKEAIENPERMMLQI